MSLEGAASLKQRQESFRRGMAVALVREEVSLHKDCVVMLQRELAALQLGGELFMSMAN